MEINLTKSELKQLIKFLENYGEDLGNAGCNDLILDNTPENRAMVKAAMKDQCDEDWDDTDTKNKKFYSTDFIVLGYLNSKLSESLKGK